MKLFLLAVLIMFTGVNVKAAESTKLLSEIRHGFYNDYSMSYDTNTDLGRAWIVVHYEDFSADPDMDMSESKRFKIEGMKLSEDQEQIIIDHNGEVIVCAEYETRRVLFINTRRLVETGRCFLHFKTITKTFDDGFHVKKRKYDQVFFSVK